MKFELIARAAKRKKRGKARNRVLPGASSLLASLAMLEPISEVFGQIDDLTPELVEL